MADEQYAAYIYEYGYPPAQPGHLISFAKKNGVKVKFTDAKKIIRAAPDTSGYVPPVKKDESGQIVQQQPATPKTQEEKKMEQMETAKRYSSGKLTIDQTKLNVDENKIIGMTKRSSASRYQFLLNKLTSQGWNKDQALEALKQSNGNLQLAIEGLMQGGGIKAGPSWSYSHPNSTKQVGGSIKDRVNKFNQVPKDEQHALDGGKWIKRRNGANQEPEQHALDGGKYIKKQGKSQQQTSQNQGQSQNNRQFNNYGQNDNQQFAYQSSVGQYDNYDQNNNHQYNQLLQFQAQSPDAQSNNYGQNNQNYQQNQYNQQDQYNQQNQNNQFEQQSGGVEYNNYGQNQQKNQQFEQESGGVQYNNYGQNNQEKNEFEMQSQGVQYNNYGQNNQQNNQFQQQSQGVQYNNYGNSNQQQSSYQQQQNNYQQNQNNYQKQNQQSQQTVQVSPPENDVNVAFERLLSGHGSIKHRLKAMDTIVDNLNGLDIADDNGKVLLSAFADQINHEDYIYRDYAVRIKAIQQISDVFIFCLNRIHYQDIPTLIDNSLPEILDNLYKLLDDNRCQKFHGIAEQCIIKIIDAIIGKRNKEATVNLCGILNEKINSENLTQAAPRFFTAKQIFPKIIFGGHSNIINQLFDINIKAFSNKIDKWTQGVNINQENDLPQDKLWFNLLIANNWNSNEDETFRDIIIDDLGIMMLDPNPDISLIGKNLTVFFSQFNQNIKNSLEMEAKHRFNRFYVPPQQPMITNTNTNNNNYQSEPLRPVQPQQQSKLEQFKQQHTGEPNWYRIKQQTEIAVAAPSLPNI